MAHSICVINDSEITVRAFDLMGNCDRRTNV